MKKIIIFFIIFSVLFSSVVVADHFKYATSSGSSITGMQMAPAPDIGSGGSDMTLEGWADKYDDLMTELAKWSDRSLIYLGILDDIAENPDEYSDDDLERIKGLFDEADANFNRVEAEIQVHRSTRRFYQTSVWNIIGPGPANRDVYDAAVGTGAALSINIASSDAAASVPSTRDTITGERGGDFMVGGDDFGTTGDAPWYGGDLESPIIDPWDETPNEFGSCPEGLKWDNYMGYCRPIDELKMLDPWGDIVPGGQTYGDTQDERPVQSPKTFPRRYDQPQTPQPTPEPYSPYGPQPSKFIGNIMPGTGQVSVDGSQIQAVASKWVSILAGLVASSAPSIDFAYTPQGDVNVETVIEQRDNLNRNTYENIGVGGETPIQARVGNKYSITGGQLYEQHAEQFIVRS